MPLSLTGAAASALDRSAKAPREDLKAMGGGTRGSERGEQHEQERVLGDECEEGRIAATVSDKIRSRGRWGSGIPMSVFVIIAAAQLSGTQVLTGSIGCRKMPIGRGIWIANVHT